MKITLLLVLCLSIILLANAKDLYISKLDPKCFENISVKFNPTSEWLSDRLFTYIYNTSTFPKIYGLSYNCNFVNNDNINYIIKNYILPGIAVPCNQTTNT